MEMWVGQNCKFQCTGVKGTQNGPTEAKKFSWGTKKFCNNGKKKKVTKYLYAHNF